MTREKLIAKDNSFVDTSTIMNRELSEANVPAKSIELYLGDALSDALANGCTYIYVAERKNGFDFDYDHESIPPRAIATWKIETTFDEEEEREEYTVYRLVEKTDINESIQKLQRENDIKDVTIDHLDKKIAELQNIIVQMMINSQGSEPTGVKVSEEIFVELVNKFNSKFFGGQDDEMFFNAEYTISFKGLTTTMGQCPALFDMFERYEQEYL